MSKNSITLGEHRYNKQWLLTVTEKQAVKRLGVCHSKGSIVKAWKIAHGLTVPDYLKEDSSEEKPKRKRVKKLTTKD